MEMSDQLHAHTALPQEKEILITTTAGRLFHGTYLSLGETSPLCGDNKREVRRDRTQQ
jgi:hypothetical protein